MYYLKDRSTDVCVCVFHMKMGAIPNEPTGLSSQNGETKKQKF